MLIFTLRACNLPLARSEPLNTFGVLLLADLVAHSHPPWPHVVAPAEELEVRAIGAQALSNFVQLGRRLRVKVDIVHDYVHEGPQLGIYGLLPFESHKAQLLRMPQVVADIGSQLTLGAPLDPGNRVLQPKFKLIISHFESSRQKLFRLMLSSMHVNLMIASYLPISLSKEKLNRLDEFRVDSPEIKVALVLNVREVPGVQEAV